VPTDVRSRDTGQRYGKSMFLMCANAPQPTDSSWRRHVAKRSMNIKYTLYTSQACHVAYLFTSLCVTGWPG